MVTTSLRFCWNNSSWYLWNWEYNCYDSLVTCINDDPPAPILLEESKVYLQCFDAYISKFIVGNNDRENFEVAICYEMESV